MGWVFLISWIVVGWLLFSVNKNAKKQGLANRYSPVVILGGSFIAALIIMGIYGSFFEQPNASQPLTPPEIAAKQEVSSTANSQMKEKKAQVRDSFLGDLKKVVDKELKKQLGHTICVKSWKYDKSAFQIFFSPNNCKPGECSAALCVVRYTFESNKAIFPKEIIIDLGNGEVQSYPFKNIPTLITK